MARSSLTLCCVGLVFSSCAAAIQGTSVTWTKMQLSRPSSWRIWRMASRNGSDSISPTVPPISTITTSTSADNLAHGGLDLVGDVRNHLHRLAEIIAAALARDDLLVDAAGGQIVGLRQLGVREALVVAEVEIGLGAVVGDEHLAVLERAHGAGIDVQVGIELLQRDTAARGFRAGSRSMRRRFPFPRRKPRRRSRKCI